MTNGGKNSQKPRKLSKVDTRNLTEIMSRIRLLAGYYCLTTYRVQNVPENSAKTSLPWLYLIDHALRREENKLGPKRLNSSKDDFLMKSFPSSTKRKLSILLNFLCPLFVF